MINSSVLISVKSQNNTAPPLPTSLTPTGSTTEPTVNSPEPTVNSPEPTVNRPTLTSRPQRPTLVPTGTQDEGTGPTSINAPKSSETESSRPKGPATNNSQTAKPEESSSNKLAIGLGIGGSVIVLAAIGIWIFKSQVGQTEKFKNRLNRPTSPVLYLDDRGSKESPELENPKPYLGYEGPQFDYNSNSETNKKWGGQF